MSVRIVLNLRKMMSRRYKRSQKKQPQARAEQNRKQLNKPKDPMSHTLDDFDDWEEWERANKLIVPTSKAAIQKYGGKYSSYPYDAWEGYYGKTATTKDIDAIAKEILGGVYYRHGSEFAETK